METPFFQYIQVCVFSSVTVTLYRVCCRRSIKPDVEAHVVSMGGRRKCVRAGSPPRLSCSGSLSVMASQGYPRDEDCPLLPRI